MRGVIHMKCKMIEQNVLCKYQYTRCLRSMVTLFIDCALDASITMPSVSTQQFSTNTGVVPNMDQKQRRNTRDPAAMPSVAAVASRCFGSGNGNGNGNTYVVGCTHRTLAASHPICCTIPISWPRWLSED